MTRTENRFNKTTALAMLALVGLLAITPAIEATSHDSADPPVATTWPPEAHQDVDALPDYLKQQLNLTSVQALGEAPITAYTIEPLDQTHSRVAFQASGQDAGEIILEHEQRSSEVTTLQFAPGQLESTLIPVRAPHATGAVRALFPPTELTFNTSGDTVSRAELFERADAFVRDLGLISPDGPATGAEWKTLYEIPPGYPEMFSVVEIPLFPTIPGCLAASAEQCGEEASIEMVCTCVRLHGFLAPSLGDQIMDATQGDISVGGGGNGIDLYFTEDLELVAAIVYPFFEWSGEGLLSPTEAREKLLSQFDQMPEYERVDSEDLYDAFTLKLEMAPDRIEVTDIDYEWSTAFYKLETPGDPDSDRETAVGTVLMDGRTGEILEMSLRVGPLTESTSGPENEIPMISALSVVLVTGVIARMRRGVS